MTTVVGEHGSVPTRLMTATAATWALRLLWFALPVTVGTAIDSALDGASDSVRLTMVIGAWVLWAVGMIATAVPTPVTLTAIRTLTPFTVAAAIWTSIAGDVDGLAVATWAHAGLLVPAAMNQLIGDRFVDGASYGNERRMTLRPPMALLAFLLPVTWAAIATGLVAGPLLLADERWLIGGIATVVGVVVVATGLRALHQLSRRWIVFVPTGFVLHDLAALTEPVLFRRTAIERLGPAIAGTPARDLSNNAAGLLLECELTDPAPLGVRDSSGPPGVVTMADVRRFLIAPTRPGAMLDEAERRGIAVC